MRKLIVCLAAAVALMMAGPADAKKGHGKHKGYHHARVHHHKVAHRHHWRRHYGWWRGHHYGWRRAYARSYHCRYVWIPTPYGPRQVRRCG